MGASRAYRHRYARYAAMPVSPYRFTRDHLPLTNFPAGGLAPRPFPSDLPLPRYQLDCLLAITIGEGILTFLLVSLGSFCLYCPGFISRRGRCGSPFVPYPAPLHGVSFPLVSLSGVLRLFGVCLARPLRSFLVGLPTLQPALSRLDVYGDFGLVHFPLSTPPLHTFSRQSPFPSLFYSLDLLIMLMHPPDLTLSTSGSVTRVILCLRTYLAGLLQVSSAGGTVPQLCLAFF